MTAAARNTGSGRKNRGYNWRASSNVVTEEITMIKDATYWEAWEAEYIRSHPADYQRNLRIFEALYEHACNMGVFPPKDPLKGLDTKIQMARVLNGKATSGTGRAGS